jgi:hypothetical protein
MPSNSLQGGRTVSNIRDPYANYFVSNDGPYLGS